MARIYLPGIKEYRDIEQIVAFGCSLTEGGELLDSLRYPHIPNIEEFKRSFKSIKLWYQYASQYTPPPSIDFDILKKEAALAWPSQLAMMYNIPCYNYAEGGSSFEKQLTQFMVALDNKKITDKTLVVWGLTIKERGIWIQPNLLTCFNLNGNLTPAEVTPTVSDFWYNTINSDMMLFWKYYNCLSIMFGWASEYCNDQFLFVQATGKDIIKKNFDITDLEYLTTNPKFFEKVTIFQKMLEPKYQKYKILNDRTHNINDWVLANPNLRLGGGHPTLEAHIQYASMIKEQLSPF
jgi:hypothetical protein